MLTCHQKAFLFTTAPVSERDISAQLSVTEIRGAMNSQEIEVKNFHLRLSRGTWQRMKRLMCSVTPEL